MGNWAYVSPVVMIILYNRIEYLDAGASEFQSMLEWMHPQKRSRHDCQPHSPLQHVRSSKLSQGLFSASLLH
jgi:hypothetical protein